MRTKQTCFGLSDPARHVAVAIGLEFNFFPAIPSRGGKIVLTPRKLRALQGKYLITYPLCPIFGYPSYGLMDRLCWWVSCARSKDTDSPRRVEKSECKAFGIKSWVGIGPPKKRRVQKSKDKDKDKGGRPKTQTKTPLPPPVSPTSCYLGRCHFFLIIGYFSCLSCFLLPSLFSSRLLYFLWIVMFLMVCSVSF